MKIRLGKASKVRAIDDGGVSMNFRRDVKSSQLSRRVILSVEVTPQRRFLTVCRPNAKNTLKKMTKKQQTATLRKFSPRCWVKSVVLSSTRLWTTNTKKYLPLPLRQIFLVY